MDASRHGFRLLLLATVLVSASRAAPAAWAPHGMVASEHRLASQAGVEMLKRGGNAVDAAVATAFAVCVLNPSSCGIGGGGFMLIYLARAHRAVALDYREVAPAAATRDMFVRAGKVAPDLSLHGGLAVAVPGEVAGLSEALRRYGKLPLATVMQPAIRLARDGFPVGAHLEKEITQNLAGLRAAPALARIFLHADGTPLLAGESVRQSALAETLQRIARGGARVFYHGDIAARIVRSDQAAGGVLTESDLARYRPTWRIPLQTTYASNTVYAMPPPSAAGVVLEVLGILHGDDLGALGRDSPAYLHLLAEAMKHAFADRAQLYGDPDAVEVPLQRLLAPQNTAALRQRIVTTRTLDQSAYGSSALQAAPTGDHGTSHLSVMDADGNAVACTTTINTGFGSMVVAEGTGIVLNNEMDDFAVQPGVPNVYGLVGSAANAIAPHKRPLSSMAPIIVTHDAEPVLAIGGSGGPLILSGTLQVLLNVLDFHLDATAAVAASRIHDQWMPPVLVVEPGVPAAARDVLAGYGHTVKEVSAMGAIQAVRRDAGVFEGVSDPRKGGEAAGW
jgi:gamma-glutamyltranspeptidase/glutathione hydrolase